MSTRLTERILFTKDEIEVNSGLLDLWKIKNYQEFRENILDKNCPFPCYFAVDAEKKGHSRYIFCKSAEEEDELLKLRDGIYQYIKSYKEIAKRTTLVWVTKVLRLFIFS
ncbi:YqcI/YcgG family protein [Priestia filamentosa]|uniref:YqcI/YcgG family protein n=1 Tax=Priestia filamentosa TaxID=1402861 RepID=UPI0039838812